MEEGNKQNIIRRFFKHTDAEIQFSAVVSSLCALSVGLNMSILDSIGKIFMECKKEDALQRKCIPCTKKEWYFIMSILSLGAPIAIYAYKHTSLSKKKALILANTLYIVGFMLIAYAYNYVMVTLGRFIVGCGVGLCSVVVPLYLSYLSKNKLIINYNLFFLMFGIFAGQVLSYSFVELENWKYRVFINLGFLFLQTFLLFFIKDVYFLVESTKKSVFSIFMSKEGRRAILPALSIHIGRQLSCVNNVIQYSSLIISGSIKPSYIVMSISCVMLLCTLLHFYLIATMKRRNLLLLSLILTSVGLFMLSTGKMIEAAIAIHIMGYTIGLGPIPWNILGNIFPPEFKEIGSNIAVAVNWMTCFSFSFIFPIIRDKLDNMCYSVFGSIMLVLAIYIFVFGKAI